MSDNTILDKISNMRKKYEEESKKVEVKFRPIAKKPKPKTEPPKENLTPMMQRLRARGSSSVTVFTSEELEENNSIKEKYLELLGDQMKAGNLLIRDVMESIDREFKEIIKDSDLYKGNGEHDLTTKMNNITLRKERYEIMELTKNQMKNWVQRDIVNYFTNKYERVKMIEPQDIEVIRKIKFTESDVVFTTDEGEYIFDGKKISNFGGYINLRTQIMTEVYDLDKLFKVMISKNKKESAEAQAKLRLMMEPLLVPAPNGKYLMASLKYLQKSMWEYLESVSTRNNLRTIALQKAKLSKEEQEIYKEDAKGIPPRKVVEDMMQHLRPPRDNRLIVYPFGFLEESGIEFEYDLDFSSKIGGSGRIDEITEDFIRWEIVDKYKVIRDITKQIEEVRKTMIDLSEAQRKSEDADCIYGTYMKLIDVDYINKEFSKDDINNLLLATQTEDHHVFIQTLTKQLINYGIISESKNTNKKAKKEDPDEGKNIDLKKELISVIREDNPDTLEGSEDDPYVGSEGYLSEATRDRGYKRGRAIKKRFIDYMNLIHESKTLVNKIEGIIETLEKIMFYEKDMTVRLELLQDVLNTYKLPIKVDWFRFLGTLYSDLYFDFSIEYPKLLDAETREETWKEIEGHIEEYMKQIQSIENKIKEKARDLENARKEYTENRKTLQKIQSLIGAEKKLELDNLEIKVEVNGYPVDMTAMVLDLLFEQVPGLESSIDESSKFSLPIPTSNEDNYLKVREMVKILGGRDYVHWADVLKILLGDSSLINSRIRILPEINDLKSSPLIDKDLRRVNDLRKFFNANLIPVEEDEYKFNQMMNVIFNNYKGLICSINYDKLMKYVIEETESLKGEEIVKYIPNVKVVDFYFPIPHESVVYPKLQMSKLITEIPNLPTTYIALNHVMDTLSKEFASSEDQFEGGLDFAIEYAELKRKFELLRRIKPYDRELSSLKTEYDSKLNDVYYLYAKLKGAARPDRRMDYEEVLERIHKLYLMNENDDKFKNAYEKSVQLKEELKEIDSDISKYEKMSQEKAKDDMLELTNKMSEVKKSLNEVIGEGLDKVTKKVVHYYNPTESRNNLISAWKHMKLDTFGKGRVLLNYIFTLVQDETPIVQSAIFLIVREFLMDLNTSKALRLKMEKSEVEKIEYTFQLVAFALKQDRVLRIKSEDLVEISNNLNPGGKKLTPEEEDMLDKFLVSLEGLSEDQISEAFKNYQHKELLNDELYLAIVYRDVNKLETQYPRWYVRDFNLAENIKIMLECGMSQEELMAEHREDTKLMSIVQDVQIDEKYLETLKRQLTEE